LAVFGQLGRFRPTQPIGGTAPKTPFFSTFSMHIMGYTTILSTRHAKENLF
jgi:hypothetical protein